MSPPASVLEVTESYAAAQRDLADEAVALVLSVTNRGRTAERWRDAVATIGDALLALQVTAAAMADDYLTDVLEAQGADVTAEALIVADAWMDFTDGGGSWLANLVFAPAKEFQKGLLGSEVQQRIEHLASSIVLNGIQDAGRSSVQAAMQARPSVGGYVRMLRPPSCARCAILAGRVYRSSTPFRRHHHCDCRHIPTSEDSGDWTTRPAKYFKSLSHAEQDRIFTKAGAEAIRLSGVKEISMNQIVNARQRIDTVSAYGRQIQIAREGTTVRALYGGYEVMSEPLPHGGFLRRRGDDELQRVPGVRYRVAKAPRLLPDEIFRLADEFRWDRTEVLRQLRRFGYLI